MSDTNPGQQLAIVEPTPESTAEQALPLIKLVALPVIEEQLRTLKPGIEKRVADAMKLVCTEENLAEIKALRAAMNKESEALHKQKMAIINEVTKPIDAFCDVYKDCVSDPYQAADNALKQKITDVENGMKKACEDTVKEFFKATVTAHHLPWLPYERVGIKIGMTEARSKAQPPKKIQTQITQYVESVAADVQTINGMVNAAEIMAEYRQCFNLTLSIRTVTTRHERIAAAQRAQEARNAAVSEDNQRAAAVLNAAQEAATAVPVAPAAVDRPTPVIPTPQTFRCRFEVEGTLEQLKLLKRFMNQNGFTYKDI